LEKLKKEICDKEDSTPGNGLRSSEDSASMSSTASSVPESAVGNQGNQKKWLVIGAL